MTDDDTRADALMATMPPGSVIITPTQMYAEIRVLSGKVDHLASVLDPALSTIRDDVHDHENRLRSVERRVWIMAGVAAAGGAGLARLASLVGG